MHAHQIYLHIAWTTLGRRPMINSATRDFLDEFIRRTIVQERAEVLVLAILQTHVHILIRTPARFDVPHLVQLLKGGSSYAASRLPDNALGLRWTREYSATSVSPRHLPSAVRYLRTQELHHPHEAVV
jgi:REP element-mobilizing transposase RayT